MTTPRANSSRRSGFTLVELLTVIGIISLLIGILVPSLSRARDIAKKTKTRAELSAIEKSLEVFQNEFKSYPESNAWRKDPILGLPDGSSGTLADKVYLSGAHWLARAMAGPDLQGIDGKADFLKDADQVGGGIPFATAAVADRKGSYLEDGKILLKDTDPKFGPFGNPGTGRLVIVDAFNGPVLYYRANSRAKHSFSNTTGADGGPTGGDPLGIYNQNDNAAFTGISGAGGWDFASTGMTPPHALATFGPDQTTILSSPDAVELSANNPEKGKSFVNFLHEHRTHETGRVIKPVKPETFVLLSAGKDGQFGTDDDVNNFSDN